MNTKTAALLKCPPAPGIFASGSGRFQADGMWPAMREGQRRTLGSGRISASGAQTASCWLASDSLQTRSGWAIHAWVVPGKQTFRLKPH